MMDKFLHDNTTEMRLARTIVLGIFSVVVTNIDLLTGLFYIDPQYKPVLVAFIMAILCPLMSEIGKNSETIKE